MADAITIKALQDASLDAKSLEEVVNGDEAKQVTTRLGESYPSVKKAIKTLFENGGLPAVPFATEALMTASALVDGDYAQVTDDADNNGLYVKEAGAWGKSAYDPVSMTKTYLDSTQTISQSYDATAFNVLNNYIKSADGTQVYLAEFNATDFIDVEPSVTYQYSVNTSVSSGGAFYDKYKQFIVGFGNNKDGLALESITSPANARYMRLSNRKTNLFPTIKAFGRYNLEKISSINKLLPRNILLNQFYDATSYVVANSYVSSTTGAFVSSAGLKRTNLVRVEPSVTYTVNSKANPATVAGCAWYDKDKVFISGFKATELTTVTAPENARYIALSALDADVATAFIESVDARFNIDKLISVVDAHATASANVIDVNNAKNLMQYETIVKSKAELQAVNTSGNSDKAYPIGRRVYDQSLRSEVYADGMFWRMPDGASASLAPRTYVYPDWLETRKALPSYAKAYKKIYDVNTTGVTGWKKQTELESVNIKISEKYGDKRLLINNLPTGISSWVYLNNSSALNPHDYLIFDYHVNTVDTAQVFLGLFAEDGTLLFSRLLSNLVMGTNPSVFKDIEHVKAEVKLSTLTPEFDGASMADVRHIGFRVVKATEKTGEIYLSNIETVTFKPMITLRFDDQRKSVYTNALPIMNTYNFKGLIAVVTGAPELDNDPSMTYENLAGMSKAELLEVQTQGWDLVSHTHTHVKLAEISDTDLRDNYRKSRDYLRKELGVSDMASSCLVSPYNLRDERAAMIQREFFDCQIDLGSPNSHMPRQPDGFWRTGSLWAQMGAFDGDAKDDANQLIAFAQQAIDEQRWGIVMMHDILPTVANPQATTIAAFEGFCAWLDANRDNIDVVTVSSVVKQIRPES